MKHVFARIVITSCLFFAGCISPQARLDALQESASGAISDVKNDINAVVQPIVETVNEIDRNVKKVQSGAALMKEGIGALKEAL
jgi:hypothetical protein